VGYDSDIQRPDSSGEAMRFKIRIICGTVALAMITGSLVLTPVLGQQDTTSASSGSRDQNKRDHGQVRPVTIPITPRVKGLKRLPSEELITLGEVTVREDGEERKVLSTRGIGNSPMSLAVLIQDDVVPSISNEIKAIGEFIRTLPKDSRVMVGYIRAGSLQVRQKFTTELDKGVRALRIPLSSTSVAPYNPYVEIIEGLKRFEQLPSGRRAMLVVTDGLDTSHGVSSSSAGLSLDLQRAIREAQRRSVAVYSFYAPTVTATESRDPILVSNAQGSLSRLSDESGGRAFFQGTGAPVSFSPFLSELGESLFMQLALTFLSTSKDKGFHKLEVALDSGVKVDYPAGYSR
jgi:hypothetical protein